MSADNWTYCPKCRHTREEAKLERVQSFYGKVPYEEFVKKMAEAVKEEPSLLDDMEETFREDYEFYGAETGILKISYSGVCQECGLTHRIDRDEKFWSPTK